jgi:hypothetical protein
VPWHEQSRLARPGRLSYRKGTSVMAISSLSFIVFGVPRSGTKALVRALNLHPNILCASERFDYRADHSRLSFPADFLDRPRSADRLDQRKHREIKAAAARKSEIMFVGNKDPRYYLTLDRINAEVPRLRNLVIYRSPYSVVPSWSRKERDHGQSRWPAGAVGLFAYLDLIVCLQRIASGARAFLFPYDLGLNLSTEPILAAVEFIGANPARFDRQAFDATVLPKRVTNPRRVPLKPYELAFLEELGASELDEIMERNWGVTRESLASELTDYLQQIRPVLPRAIDEAFRQCGNHAATIYGARYVASNRVALEGLLELTTGSEFMADLERYGPTRKAQYALSQRHLITRRLTSRWLVRRRPST